MTSCEPAFFDQDHDPKNGCEFRCEPGKVDANGRNDDGCECLPSLNGVEECNEVDDNCDGQVDDGFDLLNDRTNCGACGNTCPSPPHSESICAGGVCHYVCENGYFDNDLRAENGCEGTTCQLAAEVCNGRDDNCNCTGDTNNDGLNCGPGDNGVDEDFDKTSIETCGPYCLDCRREHASSACVNDACRVDACEPGFWDIDRRASNGCEYACSYVGEERCNQVDDNCNGVVDEGDVCSAICPSDMVPVGAAYCIDRYEASREDASSIAQGTESTKAYSRIGVLPWMVNPMSATHLAEFTAACERAGKHLCTREEWFAACTGQNQTNYVYGEKFARETCNCVDTFCDDFCAKEGVSNCSTSENCGYTYSCYHESITGAFPSCTNEIGTFDINGNVWEVVSSASDPRGYEVRGGAFNCASPSTRVTCSFNANWTALYAGFRCCKSIEGN